ncbi:hypothetical protein BJV82DRAFT_633371 [Fennellomyces sp. T-0311]|nr:hypothetical protein BJV82DRAFT_633371 [Fennellomyces sp. T-0311]
MSVAQHVIGCLGHNHDEPEWQLVIENGRLRLLSDIKTPYELSLYGQAYFRYLLPLQGLMFKRLSSIELDCKTPSFDLIINGFRFIYQAYSQNQHPQSYIPSPLHYAYGINPVVDQLVQVYVKYQNPVQPLLHVPTYLDHYRRLKDPLSCPIVLAICINTICSTRRVKGYTSIQRRQLAEFFFSKCKSILLEMFDDPDRQLDTVITISLLYHYVMMVLLDFTQARRLSTIASLLCSDMAPTYRDESNGVSPEQKAMFERIFLQTGGVGFMMNIIYGCVSDKTSFFSGDSLKALPDEDRTTREYLELYSHVLDVSFAPFVSAVMDEVERARSDTNLQHLLSVEHILQFDAAIREWWKNLPEHTRLCDDPFDGKDIIRTDSTHKLLLYGYLHATILLSYGFFIGPLYLLKASDHQNAGLANVLYEHCVSVILKSLDRTLSAVRRTLSVCVDISILTFVCLMRSVHIFHNVFSSAPDIKIPLNVEKLFVSCMEEINKTVFPLDHFVPSHQSPLKSYMATRCTEDLAAFLKYPLPGYAFAADIFNTASTYLGSRFQGSSTPPDPLSFVHLITYTPSTSVH